MTKEAVFTMKLEAELREQFVSEARAAHRPASQVMRDLMRGYVEQQRAARDHEQWIRSEIAAGLREAGDPAVVPIANEDVEAGWDLQRAALLKRIASQAE